MSRRAVQGGFALPLVLWTLGFLALIGTALLADARQQAQRVRNLVDAASAEAAAEAALQRAVFALLDPSARRWHPDGQRRELALPDHRATLRLEDEAGKVNPNLAAPELLTALLVQLGLDRLGAARLAAAIVAARSRGAGPAPQALPGTPFGSLDELALVPGLGATLLAGLRPHLSLFAGIEPDAALAGPLVAAALGRPQSAAGLPAAAPGGVEETRVMTLWLEVEGPRRTRLGQRITLRLNGLDQPRRYEILAREALP